MESFVLMLVFLISTSGAGMGFGVKFKDMETCQQSIERVKQESIINTWDDNSRTKYFAAVCMNPTEIKVEENNVEKK